MRARGELLLKSSARVLGMAVTGILLISACGYDSRPPYYTSVYFRPGTAPAEARAALQDCKHIRGVLSVSRPRAASVRAELLSGRRSDYKTKGVVRVLVSTVEESAGTWDSGRASECLSDQVILKTLTGI